MIRPRHFKQKILISAVSLALSGVVVSTVNAEAPSNEEMWLKIQEQQRMIEQQAIMIREMQQDLGKAQQVTNKHEQQIEQAARAVKEVEVKTAKAEQPTAEKWRIKPAGKAYRDKLSVWGGWSDFVPDDDANVYAVVGGGTSDLATEELKSDLTDYAGGIRWVREFDTYDYAFGFNFGGNFNGERSTFGTGSLSTGDPLSFSTPYGNSDSSSDSEDNLAMNEDSAMFFTGDVEYGWLRGGPNNIRLFAGVRAEFLEWEREGLQQLSSTVEVYDGTETSTFWGIGPRIGASFDRPINTSGNLSVFGSLSGGAMIGSLERDFDIHPDSTLSGGGFTDEDSTEIVPFGDAEFGLGYIVEQDIQIQFGFMAGYQHDVLFTASVCHPEDGDNKADDPEDCPDNESSVWTYGPFMRFNAYF